MSLLLRRRSQIIDNTGRSESKALLASTSTWHICCKGDCRLCFMKAVGRVQTLLQTEGIWGDSVGISFCCSPPAQNQSCCMSINQKHPPCGIIFDLMLRSRERNLFCSLANYCTTLAGKMFL